MRGGLEDTLHESNKGTGESTTSHATLVDNDCTCVKKIWTVWIAIAKNPFVIIKKRRSSKIIYSHNGNLIVLLSQRKRNCKDCSAKRMIGDADFKRALLIL